MPLKRSHKTGLFERAVAILDLAPNADRRVLDFGCGKGEFLGRLSKLVGANSKLVGFDAMEKSIVQAKANYPNVKFICGKFTDELPFPDASFDIVVTIDTIECVKNKERLIGEIHRVLEPHGQVLAMHWDWDTQTYNIQSREVARKAVSAFSDWKQPWMDEADGQTGRKLWGLFEGSNKFHGTPDMYSLIETEYETGKYGYNRVQDLSILVDQGGFDKGEYEQLCHELSESSAKGEYLYSITSFIYHGEKA